ncbi:MAG: hypothetical protein QM715_03770 [Nibricoccus sp.]
MSDLQQKNCENGRRDTLLLALGGALALAPFVLLQSEFSKLFWFGDDWDLLDQIQRMGTWKWTWQVFAENFVPLFKLLWSGGVHLFHGGYFGMLVLLWLTHAFNTYQFGRVLRRHGFSWFSSLVCQIVFGLTPANLETLGWSTQWSAVLATTFLLIGLERIAQNEPHMSQPTWKHVLMLVVFSTASALSFSRGILTGAIFALACLWPAPHGLSFAQRLLQAALYTLPGFIVAVLIMSLATGNHQNFNGHLLDAADYALWVFCMNPLYRLVEMDSWGLHTIAILGISKVLLVGWGLLRCDRRQRMLLILLLAFDFGNAALLGIGRYHTGLVTTISSRYQYSTLIATLPYIAIWIEYMVVVKLGSTPRLQRSAIVVAIVLILVLSSHRWPNEIRGFAQTRGSDTRKIIFTDPNPPENGAIPGISFLSTARAKELTKHYNLH